MKLSVESIEPHSVFRTLNNGGSHPRNGQREIKVSFRGPGGAVGRRDFATHWIHWYPAKMFHRIPSVFLDTIGLSPRSTILDPFCGSGTVLLESNVRGHDAIGVDVNPLARLISRVKTTPIDPKALHRYLEDLLPRAVRSRAMPVAHPTLDPWLPRASRVGLHRLHAAIHQLANDDVKAFFVVTLTSIVRQISYADPAIPPLVRLREERSQTAGPRYRKALRKVEKMTTSTVYREFTTAAEANIRRMSELDELRCRLGNTHIGSQCTDAIDTGLMPESVDAVVTSPPYCGSQKYVRSLKLEMILSGCSVNEIRKIDRQTLGTEAISRRPKDVSDLLTGHRYCDQAICSIYLTNPVRARMASDYAKYLSTFASECRRVLRPGGHLLVTLGRSTIAGVQFKADHIFRDACQEIGLESIATLVDEIQSRGLITRRNRTAGRIDREHIVWLQRPKEPSRARR